MVKLDKETINAIALAINEGRTNTSISEEFLGKASKESSLRRWKKEGRFIIMDIQQVAPSLGNVYDAWIKNKTVEAVLAPYMKVRTTPNKQYLTIETSKYSTDGCKHFVIPDTQVKDGIDTSYLSWVGEYIVSKRPDVIVHLGDHADMPSLSSYDKGKKKAEGRRVEKDINAAIRGMNLLLQPLYDLQQRELAEFGEVRYKPRMVLTLGNHEERIMRHVNANPELAGFLSYDNLKYKEMGWEVYDFLKPIIINGITYCHFMANPMTGKPYGGAALNILKNVGESFIVGHKQTLDVATRFLPASGRQQWGIVCGSCYLHHEDYKGHQGNHHFRGVIICHNVSDGSYNPMFVNLDYLGSKYRGSS